MIKVKLEVLEAANEKIDEEAEARQKAEEKKKKEKEAEKAEKEAAKKKKEEEEIETTEELVIEEVKGEPEIEIKTEEIYKTLLKLPKIGGAGPLTGIKPFILRQCARSNHGRELARAVKNFGLLFFNKPFPLTLGKYMSAANLFALYVTSCDTGYIISWCT